jgi:hypothetical protein
VGSERRGTARLTGGPGRDGARSSAVGCGGEAARQGTDLAGPGRQWEREGKWAAPGPAGGGKGVGRARKHSSI